jgi:hypothetical protein
MVMLEILGATLAFLIGIGLLAASREARGRLQQPGRSRPAEAIARKRRDTGSGFRINITSLDFAYLAAMLSGVFGKEVWDQVNSTGSIGVRWAHLIGALIVSPVVYGAVQNTFFRDELSIAGLAIAFQNGFFWQSVFEGVQHGH